MNGTSGFQEMQSSTPRSPSYRLLHEQQPQFGTGFWHHFHAQTSFPLLKANPSSLHRENHDEGRL
jgi:hypothetical protein